MQEIDKLRQRLKNVKKGVTEYRMTVVEAHALVREFDLLEKSFKEKSQVDEKIDEVIVDEPTITTRIIDGGVL